ncbi:MAG: hypothetical protein ACRCYR_17720 [Phycicoccus sp.]
MKNILKQAFVVGLSASLMVGLAGTTSASAAPNDSARQAPTMFSTAEDANQSLMADAVDAASTGAPTTIVSPGAPTDLVPAPMLESTTAEGGSVTPLVTQSDLRRLMASASIDVNWWGVQVKFTRGETASIATGAASCRAFIDRLKLPGAAKTIIRAACDVLWVAAANIYASGNCLAYNSYYVPPGGHPWAWDC